MDYEERSGDTKISFRLAIIIMSMLFLISFIVFLFLNNKGQELIIDCSSINTFDSFELDINTKLYDKKNHRELVMNYIMKIPENLEVDLDSDVYEKVVDYIEKEIKKMIIVPKSKYNFSTKIKDDYVNYEVVFLIDEDSELSYEKMFKFDIMNSNKEQLIDYFETGGMKCKK